MQRTLVYDISRFGKVGKAMNVAGNALGVTAVFLTGYDILQNGLNYSNGLDLTMEGVSFISGVGWIVGGAYFLGNAALKGVTGKDIGETLYYNSYEQKTLRQTCDIKNGLD